MSNTRRPGVIPNVPAGTDPATRQFLEAVREKLQVYQGQRGDSLDKAVTFRDFDDNFGSLKKGLVLEIKRELQNGGPSPDIGAPTGFGVVALFGECLLHWDEIRHGNYSYTEVFRAEVPVDANGVMIGEAPPFSTDYRIATVKGSRVNDSVQPELGYVYWARHLNASGSASPFSGPIFITTSQLPSVMLDQLQKELDNDEFVARLLAKIDPISLEPLRAADAALNVALADAEARLTDADAQLDASIAQANAAIYDADVRLSAADVLLQDNLNSAKSLLQSQLDGHGFAIVSLQDITDTHAMDLNAITYRVGEAESTIIELDTVAAGHASRLTSIESVNTTQGSSISSLQTTTDSHATAITRLGAYDTQANKYAFIKTLEEADASQASRVTTLEADNTSNKSRIATVESTTAGHATRVTALESDNTSNKSRITTVESTTAGHASRLTSVETTSASNSSSIATLQTTTTTNATSIERLRYANNGTVVSLFEHFNVVESSTRIKPSDAYGVVIVGTGATTTLHARDRLLIEPTKFYKAVFDVENLSGATVSARCRMTHFTSLTSASTRTTGSSQNVSAGQRTLITVYYRGISNPTTTPVSTVMNAGETHILPYLELLSFPSAAQFKLHAVRIEPADLEAYTTNEVTRLTSVDAGQATQITLLETDNSSNKNRITTVESTTQNNATRVTTLESDNSSNKSRIGTLETTSATTATRLNTLETDNGSNKSRITSLETTDTAHASRLVVLETDNGSNKGRITTLETTDATQAKRIDQLRYSQSESSKLVNFAAFSTTFTGAEPAPVVASGNVSMNAGNIRITGSTWFYSVQPIRIDTNRKYSVRFVVKQVTDPTSGGAAVYAGVATLDGNFNSITGGAGTHRYCAVSGQTITVAQGRRIFEGTITGTGDTHGEFRAGTVYVRPMFLVNYNGGDGVVEVESIELLDTTNYAAVETTSRAYTDTLRGNLTAEYVLKVDSGGNVAGFGLLSNPNTGSQINFSADKIRFVNPNNTLESLALQIQEGRLYFNSAIARNFSVENLTFKDAVGLDLSVISNVIFPPGKIVESNLHPDFLNRIVMVDPSASTTGGTTSASRNIASIGTSLTSYIQGGNNLTKITIVASSFVYRSEAKPIGSPPLVMTAPDIKFKVKRGSVFLAIPDQVINSIPELTVFDAGNKIYRLQGQSRVSSENTSQTTTFWEGDASLNVSFSFDAGNFSSNELFGLEITAASGDLNGTLRADVFEPVGSTGGLVVNTSWDSVKDKPATATRWPTWSEVTSKPATFAPSPHTHSADDITSGILSTSRLSGTYPISVSGNAATATALTTARTLTVGNTGKTFNGSGNVSWSLSEIGALPLTGGTLTGALTAEEVLLSGTNSRVTLNPLTSLHSGGYNAAVTAGERVRLATVTIPSVSQNATFTGKIVAQSSQNFQEINFTLTIRTNTSPATAHILIMDSTKNATITATLEIYKDPSNYNYHITMVAGSTTQNQHIYLQAFTRGNFSKTLVTVYNTKDIFDPTGFTLVTPNTTAPLNYSNPIVAPSFNGDGSQLGNVKARSVTAPDFRGNNYLPTVFGGNQVEYFFDGSAASWGIPGSSYCGVMTFRPWGNGADWSGGAAHQIAFADTGDLWHRTGTGSWNTARKIARYETSGYLNVLNWVLLADSTGLFYPNGTHLFSLSDGNMTLRGTGVGAGLRMETSGGTVRGHFYASIANDIGILTSDGNWALWVDAGKNCHVVGNMNAQRFYASSSRRFKDINYVASVHESVERVKAIGSKGVSVGRYKGKEALNRWLIAEEVAEVSPEVISRDVEGRVSELDYTQLVPDLYAALADALKRIEQLEARYV